jgi:ERCC4-type nuclease
MTTEDWWSFSHRHTWQGEAIYGIMFQKNITFIFYATQKAALQAMIQTCQARYQGSVKGNTMKLQKQYTRDDLVYGIYLPDTEKFLAVEFQDEHESVPKIMAYRTKEMTEVWIEALKINGDVQGNPEAKEVTLGELMDRPYHRKFNIVILGLGYKNSETIYF